MVTTSRIVPRRIIVRQTSLRAHIPGATAEWVRIDGAELAVETLGSGPIVLLLHGFPHTRAIWRDTAPALTANGFRVVVPDLHGLGDSAPAVRGYEARALASDLIDLLRRLDAGAVHVVGTDLGVAPAFAMAAGWPERVTTLTLTEGLVGELPGAEVFLRNGPPWWFGFHRAPGGLAEHVLVGSEERYVRFFLEAGSRRGLPDDLVDIIVDAYRGRQSLAGAFAHYRAMAANAEWIATWAAHHTLTLPVLSVAGGAIGDATARQLAPIANRLSQHTLPDAGHITPIDQPDDLAALIARHAKSA